MFQRPLARVQPRALSRTVALGAAVAAGLGGSVAALGLIDDGLSRSRAERFADAAARGFSESALRAQGGDAAPGAMNIAQRFDPYSVALGQGREELIAARLQLSQTTGRKPIDRPDPPAEAFQTGGALNSARELECLTQAVYYEARGEGAAGQSAVAQVVLNRVRHRAFPRSICGVVFQGASARKCQFSFACDGSIRRQREPGAWRRAQQVAARALSGQVFAEVGSATHFHATRVSPRWNRMVRVAAVGQHVFYRFGGRGAPEFRVRARPEAETRPVYASILPTPSAAPEPPRQLAEEAPASVVSTQTPARKPAPAPVEPSARPPVAAAPAVPVSTGPTTEIAPPARRGRPEAAAPSV